MTYYWRDKDIGYTQSRQVINEDTGEILGYLSGSPFHALDGWTAFVRSKEIAFRRIGCYISIDYAEKAIINELENEEK